MRISDWSSDVCSSDLLAHARPGGHARRGVRARAPLVWRRAAAAPAGTPEARTPAATHRAARRHVRGDRKSVVVGKSVSVRVDLGGRRILKQKKNESTKIREYD